MTVLAPPAPSVAQPERTRLKTKKDVEKRALERAKDFSIEATMDNVIVKRLEESMTESGLYVAKTEQKFLPSNQGIVVAVGPGKTLDNGTFLPTKLKPGQKVWFHLFPSGCEVQEAGDPDETYIIIAEKQCVGVVKSGKGK